MRVVRRISAVIIGFVFFVAGLLKLMDPVGAGLVVEEYFKFFHLGFLRSLSLIIGTGLALVETIIGAALITGVWRRYIAIASAALLAPFTVITLILLIFNPSMDCGCFGEAIHLSHLQSFLKNLALCVLWVLSFIPFSEEEPTRKIKYVSFSIAGISVCFFLLYSALSIPIVDYTPFKPGAELMQSETIISFCDANGEYADSLAQGTHIIAVSIYAPERVGARQSERIAALVRRCEVHGYTPLILTAYGYDAPKLSEDLQPYCYFADRKTLMTLNRANGGVTYISDSQIITKWGAAKLPQSDKLAELYNMDATEALISESQNLKLQAFLLYVFAVMLLL